MSKDNQLKVLSFNCWGLLYISKHRRFRIEAIAEFLSKQDYDIIGLQELWVQSDFDHVKEKLQPILPFAKYFYSGTFGSGLAIFSRFPILSSSFHKYTLNGKPLQIFHGDYYVGKGIAAVTLEHPQLGYVDVFNTHLHAGYGDRYKAHRATECWELAKLLRSSAAAGRQVILAGDFNSVPRSLNYFLIRDYGLVTDAWPQNNDPGFTCNSPFNTFSRYYRKGNVNAGKRLDYIFYRQTPQLTCVDSKLVMTDFIPGHDMSYSDHFGVVSLFSTNDYEQMETCDDLQLETINALLDLLIQEHALAKRDSNRLLGCMLVCVLLVVALFVITIVLPTIFRLYPQGYLATVLVPIFCNLLMVLLSSIACFCLVVGLVFGFAEQRIILEFIEEIKLVKQKLI